MLSISSRPSWMHSLPASPPALTAAFKLCVDAYRRHVVPSHVCRQCLSEEMERQIISAARLAQAGKTPPPQDFGQIYFEHPGCVGGEETIKLFAPHGIRTMLTGCPPPGFSKNSCPEVLETMLRAGLWFWSTDLIEPLRVLAARLFWDWFRDGRYEWRQTDPTADELLDPGDDIMSLCIACLIDPADLIAALAKLHTPQSDAALGLAGTFVPEPPFYFSYETGQDDDVYKLACDQIATSLATREAQAMLHYITPDWLQKAFWRHEREHPGLAADLSRHENYYDIQTVKLRERADRHMLINWPDLARI